MSYCTFFLFLRTKQCMLDSIIKMLRLLVWYYIKLTTNTLTIQHSGVAHLKVPPSFSHVH